MRRVMTTSAFSYERSKRFQASTCLAVLSFPRFLLCYSGLRNDGLLRENRAAAHANRQRRRPSWITLRTSNR